MNTCKNSKTIKDIKGRPRSRNIVSLRGREILDSRGNPTIEIEMIIDKESFFASVPSGASRGKYEAVALEAKKAVRNINKLIAPKLKGKDVAQQKEIDEFLIGLDATKNKSKLGANAILGVSMACGRAGAAAQNLFLWQYIRQLTEDIPPLNLPRPCFNIINGGLHAGNDLDFQEFMIVPQFNKFSKNLQEAKKIYKNLAKTIKKKFKKLETGYEGGFSPPIFSTKEALNLIKEASDGFKDIKIILDCAASQFQKGKKYKLEGKLLSKEELAIFYQELIPKYPIIGLEDPFAEDDWPGWKKLISNFQFLISKPLVIGDDLTVTNPERIKQANKKKACQAIIIKPNQIGTISETIGAAKLAKSFGWKIMVSHRSGETEDDFIADLAVGLGADFIKSGAPFPKERMVKYNRLLKIEKELNRSATKF